MNTALTMKPLLLAVPVLLITGCASHRLSQADQAYDLMRYEEATKLYDKYLLKHADRAAIIRCAEAHRKQNELAQALQRYTEAETLAPLAEADAMNFARVLMSSGEEGQAAEMLQRVLQDDPMNLVALELFGSCKGYQTFFQDSNKYIVNRLNLPGLNAVFSAVPWKKGLMVVGERKAPKARQNPWNGQSFLDLYYSERKTMVTWLEAQALPKEVNGRYHEGPVVFSANGRIMYFTRSNYYKHRLNMDGTMTSHLKLFRATMDSTGGWTDVREFSHNSEDYSVGHPALSADGRTLYFASDKPGGFGGTDIWKCHDNGSYWSEPVNLGPVVNTAGDELFPVVNGSALNFSSTGHDNMGGLDIFETTEVGGHWTDPTNLHSPVNTEHDDFAFIVDKSADVMESGGMSGYLSSDRSGVDQVYSFWAPAPVFAVDGEVFDQAGVLLPNTEVTLTSLFGAEDTSMVTGADGRFHFDLKPGTDYTIKAINAGFLSSSQPISTKGLTQSDTLQARFGLVGVTIDAPIAINNILYDYDRWEIRPDAAHELDKLVALFVDNPHMTFELGAHTDSRGGDMYNLVLSEQRARSAENYLIQKGVDPERISSRGYGETVLTNRCGNGARCTEEEHQDNRRTEFRVTGINLAHKH